MQRDYRDFALRMSEVLNVLEQVENRNQQKIFDDLITTGMDVIRVQLKGQDLTDGSLPIEEYARIAQRTKEMMLAAACSVIQPRAVLPTRKPAEAMDYLQGVRIGQSERGSYVLTIHSRVAPLLKSGGLDIEEPFPRQVVSRLALALYAIEKAAEYEDLNFFKDGIKKGISANLCDAVAGLAGHEEHPRQVEVVFSWSPKRPLAQVVPSRTVFQEDRMPIIAEAGRELRANSPLEDYELQGSVVKLERQEAKGSGRVTILGFVDEKPRKISMLLEEYAYQAAIDAHKNGHPIRCTGTLKKEGRGFELLTARSFHADVD